MGAGPATIDWSPDWGGVSLLVFCCWMLPKKTIDKDGFWGKNWDFNWFDRTKGLTYVPQSERGFNRTFWLLNGGLGVSLGACLRVGQPPTWSWTREGQGGINWRAWALDLQGIFQAHVFLGKGGGHANIHQIAIPAAPFVGFLTDINGTLDICFCNGTSCRVPAMLRPP